MKLIHYSVFLNCVLWCSAAVLQDQEAAPLTDQQHHDVVPQVNGNIQLENLRFVATFSHNGATYHIITATNQSSNGTPNLGAQNVQKIVNELIAAQKKANKKKKKGNGKKGGNGKKKSCKSTKCNCNGSTTAPNDTVKESGTTTAPPVNAPTTNKGTTPEGTGTATEGTTPEGTGTTPVDEYGDYQDYADY